MSYSKERLIQLRRRKKWRTITTVVAVFLFCGVCIFSAYYPAPSWQYYFMCPKVEPREEGEMRLHFLSVGQGDCTLVEFPDGKTMLVDGGSPYGYGAKKVMRYLNALKIRKLDYVVVTGTETGRCGALGELAKYKKIGYAYHPQTATSGSPEYITFCSESGRKSTPASKAERYLRVESETEENYSFTFLLPYSNETAADSALWIEWNGYGVLLFGGIDEETETQLFSDARLGYFAEYGIDLQAQTTLVRMCNYGKATGITKEFYEYLSPQAVVTSCLQSVSFTPDDWAVPVSSEHYRTDLNGTVVATFTSEGLVVKTEK